MAAEFRLRPRPVEEIRHGWRWCTSRYPTDEQADVRQCLQEPRARVVGGTDARSLRTSRAPDRRRADLAQARELHRERRWCTIASTRSSQTEARWRALEEFGVELEHEVQLLGPSSRQLRAGGVEDLAAAKLAPWRMSRRPLPSGWSRPVVCSQSASASRCRGFSASSPHVRLPSSPFTTWRSSRYRTAIPSCRPGAEDLHGTSLLRIDREIQRRLDKLPHVHLLGYDWKLEQSSHQGERRAWPAAVVRRGDENWLVSAEGRVLRPLERRLRRPQARRLVERTVDLAMWSTWSCGNRRERSGPSPRSVQRPPARRRVCGTYMGDDGTGATAVLDDWFEIRLGSTSDLPLKPRSPVASSRGCGARRRGRVSRRQCPRTAGGRRSLESQVEPETVVAADALTAQ